MAVIISDWNYWGGGLKDDKLGGFVGSIIFEMMDIAFVDKNLDVVEWIYF